MYRYIVILLFCSDDIGIAKSWYICIRYGMSELGGNCSQVVSVQQDFMSASVPLGIVYQVMGSHVKVYSYYT